MSKVKLGIVGFGNMGTGYTKNILDGLIPEVELVAIAGLNPDRNKTSNGTCSLAVLPNDNSAHQSD